MRSPEQLPRYDGSPYSPRPGVAWMLVSQGTGLPVLGASGSGNSRGGIRSVSSSGLFRLFVSPS